jgi:hypothetical protein
MIATDGQDFTTCLPTVDPHTLGMAHARALGSRARGLSILGKCQWGWETVTFNA